MFSENLIVNIDDLLNEEYKFYAHTNENSKETLQEHTNRCIKYFNAIIKEKELESIFQNFIDLWFSEHQISYGQLFFELIINTIVFHDLGKINPLFQSIKMKNSLFSKENGDITLGSDHSIVSAILYLEFFLTKCMNFPKEIRDRFMLLTYVNAYVISKHHGNLDRFGKFLDAFNEEDSNYRYFTELIEVNYKNYFKQNSIILDVKNCVRCVRSVIEHEGTCYEDSIALYAYEKLIYSLLVASDFYATAEYNNNFILVSHGNIEEIHKIRETFDNTNINQNIEEYRKIKYYDKEKNLKDVKDINILRCELYLEAEESLLNNLNESIFYLEAPTGSGKSNIAFNLSFHLIRHCKDIKKIMYIYPFNTLIDQNLKLIEGIFENDTDVLSNITVVNSVTPILKEGDKNYSYTEYEKALLDRQFFNYPITLSTHVTLFDLLFGSNKESGFAFYQLSNSVIVLDEIQSYKNTIWTEIITFLKVFSKLLNIKIIIMSATLPNLDILTSGSYKAVKLIGNRNKYFLHPLFKDRVLLNYELIGIPNIFDELYKKINSFLVKGNKILIEFITKKSAMDFYKYFTNTIDKNNNIKVELITGDDSRIERTRILNEIEAIKDGVPFLLISTQVIEAGVDLKNIDIGFKDISKLDSEEQFMGRINRSSKKNGTVYFFDYDNAKNIYKKDVRINDRLTLKSEDMRKILNEKRFDDYYKEVLKLILSDNESSAIEKNINNFFTQIKKLNVPLISDRMRLIDKDDWSCTVFLNRQIDAVINGEILDGKKIWNEYKYLLKNRKEYNYAEWRVKLSIVKSKMNYFIYQVNKKCSFPFTEDYLGEIFYIEDAEQYFDGGKFNREKFESQVGAFI